ncbi:hypothetical protein GP475_07090 [Corynebacterium poyangense]|uniref:Cell wall anchor protein n=1 Tax=Corynebacterium poyangense TaxID=2684405 RepID=A0A7H0SPF0_9CORY|nr:hypothetical protein [Corynebacterium poyangense]QNQ90425.1 hypothetical protein GP475_07090 [Corynebacterium poyangense]
MTTSQQAHTKPQKHSAGAFDIRNVIGALLGIYGILLLFSGFLLNPGINLDTNELKHSEYNIYAGVVLLVVAAGFFLWSKLRPIVVDEAELAAMHQEGPAH